MYGLETIQTLNRKNAEAAAIMVKHEQPAKIPNGDGVANGYDLKEHLAHAQETKDRILNGARG